jgi:hypothetical protein
MLANRTAEGIPLNAVRERYGDLQNRVGEMAQINGILTSTSGLSHARLNKTQKEKQKEKQPAFAANSFVKKRT